MAIQEKETKKYESEELSKFNETLNKFYILHKIQYADKEREIELLDVESVRERFLASKPEVPKEQRLETFENLYRQWREWKFAEHFHQEVEREKLAAVSHLQN